MPKKEIRELRGLTPILDSGGLLAALDPDQNHHEALVASVRGPRVISPFVVAELNYTILRNYWREGR